MGLLSAVDDKKTSRDPEKPDRFPYRIRDPSETTRRSARGGSSFQEKRGTCDGSVNRTRDLDVDTFPEFHHERVLCSG